MYPQRPNNWHEMTSDEQRDWKLTQDRIEDAEYQERQAREAADRAADKATQLRHAMIDQRRELSDAYSGEIADLHNRIGCLVLALNRAIDALKNDDLSYSERHYEAQRAEHIRDDTEDQLED
jgi:hypothetical protein